ncbi:hypothetical protein [Listeria monocytogenes]|uniref:hypothetical protein n=1 Tax=Listeria monocytogenes TaxID=1639 RepID=UPI0011EB9BCF|nr:hypothetical protein [Listeria monocytogenes]MCD2222827.1 hypothetical protein [Listeria monocytogenes]TYW24665.1 hypothetical protein FZ082_12880 [Listeria monocytogenes]
MKHNTLTIKEYQDVDLNQFQEIKIIYCRLSQDDGNSSDSDSIINQKSILVEEVNKKNLLIQFTSLMTASAELHYIIALPSRKLLS